MVHKKTYLSFLIYIILFLFKLNLKKINKNSTLDPPISLSLSLLEREQFIPIGKRNSNGDGKDERFIP